MINLVFKLTILVGLAHFLPIEEDFFFVSNEYTETSHATTKVQDTTNLTALSKNALVPATVIKKFESTRTTLTTFSTVLLKTITDKQTETQSASKKSTKLEILFAFIGISLLLLVLGYKTHKFYKNYRSKRKQRESQMPVGVIFFPRTSTVYFDQNFSQSKSYYDEIIDN
jgi:hypothetical protein